MLVGRFLDGRCARYLGWVLIDVVIRGLKNDRNKLRAVSLLTIGGVDSVVLKI